MKLESVVEVVLKSLYARSAGLYRHALATGKIAQQIVIAGELGGEFDPQQAHIAGMLHDVGKLFLTDSILFKTGSLGEDERGVVNLHPIWGAQFVQDTELEMFRETILYHHECPTGTGYPYGIVDVGFKPRIIQAADCLAALMDNRPYRREVKDPDYLLQEMRTVVERLFAGERERKMMHGIRVVLGLTEGKHSRPLLSVVNP